LRKTIKRLVVKRRGEKLLKPVRPNIGIEVAYRRKLLALVDAMARSYEYWLKACYRQNEPVMTMATDEERLSWARPVTQQTITEPKDFFTNPDYRDRGFADVTHVETKTVWMAMDATPASQLKMTVNRLGRYWNKRFNETAKELADYFALSAAKRSDAALRSILKKGGWSVQFRLTPAMKDIVAATVAENVALIKSIPAQYHTEVNGLVMRSVTAGRDLAQLTDDLEKRYDITRKRAALIARDQNAKMTGALQRARQIEIGITEAIWLHSHGGKTYRKTHLANDRKRYNVATGWWDPDPKVKRFIAPGELINCFPGSTRIDFAHQVEKAFRHFYCGELAEIVTHSSKSLRATPNHPILTPHGWRSIGALDEGDYIIEVADHGLQSVISEGDIDEAVSSIANIFSALSGLRSSKIALGDEFHGDAIANSNIDVVLSDRTLSFGRKFLHQERLEKFGLTVSDHPTFCQSPFAQLVATASFAANGIMSGASELLSLFRRSIGHSSEHCFAAVPNGAAYPLDPNLDRFSLVSEFLRKGKNAAPTFVQSVQAVRVVSIERRRFSGHVYNLQTKDGYYSAEGIICHNCRCVSRPIVKGFS
jgi:hypothetical protein